MPTGDTPDFLDGLDEPPAFSADLPDLPDLPGLPTDGWPDAPAPVDLTTTPPPRLTPPLPEPAPPAVTPPPVGCVTIHRPVELPPADDRVTVQQLADVEEDEDGVAHVAMLIGDPARGLTDVRVTLPVPTRARRVGSNRPMRSENGLLTWELGDLAAGGEVEVRAKFAYPVRGRALFAQPPAFELSYRQEAACVLAAEVTGPGEVSVGVPFTVALQVSNRGTLPSGRVRVSVIGQSSQRAEVIADLASVAPGEETTRELTLTAGWGGGNDWQIELVGEHDGTTAAFTTTAVAPELSVVLTHDKSLLIDTETEIAVTVTNQSRIAVRDVAVWLTLPDELAAGERVGGRIEWPPIDLAAGEAKALTTRVRGHAAGLAWLRAKADAGGELTATAGGSLWCELDPRAGGTSLEAVLTAVQASAADDWQRPNAEAQRGERHVLFDLAGTRFAAPIGQVREVIRPPAVTPVPGMPDWLKGLTNVRGDVVSVVDLPGFLRLDERPDATRRGLLLAHTADGEVLVGLLVDEVASIRRLPTDGPALPPGLEGDRVTPFLSGVCEHQQRLIPRLDLERLLRADELHSLSPA